MDIRRFVSGDCRFAVLDLMARSSFCSATSISFELGKYSTLDPQTCSDLAQEFPGKELYHPVGRVDVHHPCESHIKAQFWISLPVSYHTYDQMQELLNTIFFAISVPMDETYEAHIVTVGSAIKLENAVDRDGMTDRIDVRRPETELSIESRRSDSA